LGVDRIIPLMTERVIVRMDRDKMRERHARWKAIALAATKQCQRNIVPTVDQVTEIRTLIESSKEFDGRFIPTFRETGVS
jgi:16S rRNA (uracil1498-N3)-methyltransferase